MLCLKFYGESTSLSGFSSGGNTIGLFIFAINSLPLAVGGIVSLKVYNRVDVHKDCMAGLIVNVGFGIGVIRWVQGVVDSLWGGCFGPIPDNISYFVTFVILNPSVLLALYYRAGRLQLWWNLVISLSPLTVAIGTWVGNAVYYKSTSLAGTTVCPPS